MMSSFDTVTGSLLKRMPTFRSSNHSTIVLSLPKPRPLALLREPGSKPDLHWQTIRVNRRDRLGYPFSDITSGNCDSAGVADIVPLCTRTDPCAREPHIQIAKTLPLQQISTKRISLVRFLGWQRLVVVQPQEHKFGMNLPYVARRVRSHERIDLHDLFAQMPKLS